MATDIPVPTGSPLFKALASSSRARRQQAMASLRSYLSSPREFTYTDYLKLWKALFFCLYMTPKMRVQQRLSIEISELVLQVAESQAKTADAKEPPSKKRKRNTAESGTDGVERDGGSIEQRTTLFVRAFWDIMKREWPGIDKARIDKFLFLVRRVVYTSLLACRTSNTDGDSEADTPNGGVDSDEKIGKAEEVVGDDEEMSDGNEEEAEDAEEEADQYEWEEAMLKEVMQTFREVPFHPRDPQVPVGLRLHVLDVFVDELERADPEHKAPSKVLLSPLRTLQKETMTKTVRVRAKETLEDERLAHWTGEALSKPAAGEDSVQTMTSGEPDVDAESEDEFAGFD